MVVINKGEEGNFWKRYSFDIYLSKSNDWNIDRCNRQQAAVADDEKVWKRL